MAEMPLQVELDGERRGFRPGETISGSFSWSLPKAPKWVELRLCWYTVGKGTRDEEVVCCETRKSPGPSGSGRFEMALPLEPYSFSGKLISLCWAVEVVAKMGWKTESEKVGLVMSSTGAEVLCAPQAPGWQGAFAGEAGQEQDEETDDLS